MEVLQKNPGLFMIEGILLVILGTLAIALPQLTTLSVTLIVGTILLIGGIYRFFRTLMHKKEVKYFWLSLASGIIAALSGIYLLINPLAGILVMTILIGLFFLVDGISSVTLSLMSRSTNKYWSVILLSGIISFILAALILSGLPYTAIWTIGLLVGINMITYGFSIALAAANTHQLTEMAGT